MKAGDFKPGDVVRLKSSKIHMTISSVEFDGQNGDVAHATCLWFDDGNHLHREIFAAATLRLVVPRATRKVA